MTYETINLTAFFIVGIAVKTTNQNEQSQKDIEVLWQQFLSNNIMEQIPDKETNEIYCIYTDYESDQNGHYTTILGCKVTSLDNIPDGLIGKAIPKAKFQMYKSNGKLPESVLATWKYIWQTPINRQYLADFDVYSALSQDQNNSEVTTYISVQ